MNKLIENFILLERISVSDFSEVFKSKHKITNEFFAIKVVSFEKFSSNPKYQEQLSNELRALKLLESFDHIVKFIKLLKTKNNVYLVYEYCEGGTLQEYEEKKKKLSENEAISLFKQIVEGLFIIHSNNIVHGDLKPSNLLFKGQDLKILDFGFCKFLSKDLKKNNMSEYFMGSPIYTAPELFENSETSQESDIYALGVIFYEMLFGIAPFEEKNLEKLIERIQKNYTLKFPREINNISLETENLLRNLLEKDPKKRYSILELIEILKSPQKKIVEDIKKSTIKGDFDEKLLLNLDEIKNLDVFKNVEEFKTHKNVENVKTIIFSEMSSYFLKQLTLMKKPILNQIKLMKSILDLNLDESNVGLILLLLKKIKLNYIEIILALEKNFESLFYDLMKIPSGSIQRNQLEEMKNDQKIREFVSILINEEKQCEDTLISYKNTLRYSFELPDYNTIILKEINQDVFEESVLKKTWINYAKKIKETARDLFSNCKNETILKEILCQGNLGFDILDENVKSLQYENKIKEFELMSIVNLYNLFEKKFTSF